MGRRGPKAKGRYGEVTQVLSTRITASLRTALEAASKTSGLSLSSEVERRLRRSFNEDEKITAAFGSRRNYALMKVMASVLGTVNPERPDAEWVDDPYTFEQVIKGVNAVLEALRPAGDIPAFRDPMLAAIGPAQEKMRAAAAFAAIQGADPIAPLTKTAKRQRVLATIKEDLGELANRPRVVIGSAKEFRRVADEMERSERPKGRKGAKR
jgi:hypothetical protein